MCLIALALDPRSDARVVLAANRDEYLTRPTEPAHPWPEAPHVLAGRDLRGGGTWLGVTRDGRFAALTNFRDPADRMRDGAPSRGGLVRDFLSGTREPAAYLRDALARGADYAGFSLIVGDRDGAHCGSNRGAAAQPIAPGVHGLSNHRLDTPWPKVERARAGLARAVEGGRTPPLAELIELLSDPSVPADPRLPDTGVGLDMERLLGSIFIETPVYGTRSSTALLIHADGTVRMRERTHTPGAAPVDRDFELRPEGPP